MSVQWPSLRCPKCGQIDRVQKVSIIYEGGISKSEYKTIMPPPPKTNWAPLPITREAVSQTELSRKLAPPPKPVHTINWLLFVLFGGAAFLLLCAATEEWGGSGFLAYAPAYVAVLVYGLIEYARKKNVEAKLPEWHALMYRWNQLYYCGRDGSVFIPGENRVVPVDQMISLLYE